MSQQIVSMGKIILASASPRRRELLAMMGLDFEVLPSLIDESIRQGEEPVEHVLRLSREKTTEPAALYPEAWIIGADTIVTIDGEILGKPSSGEEAKKMLKKLSGRKHRVFTGIAILRQATAAFLSKAVASDVLFKEIPEEEIGWYVHTGEPRDKAGGYALQGSGAFFVREIRGSYTNVIGLPLCELVELLKLAGAIKFPGVNNGC